VFAGAPIPVFAALRLIKNNPVVKAWYQAKTDTRFKNKTVIAVMCKLFTVAA